jgi:NO-binding membrane sensor protein with MHYT domain
MLGYDPGVVGYDIGPTLGSLLIAIAMTSVGLLIASRIARPCSLSFVATSLMLAILPIIPALALAIRRNSWSSGQYLGGAILIQIG